MASMDESDCDVLSCAKCGAELTPGKGDFYVVRIEAVADPSPPSFSEMISSMTRGRQSNACRANVAPVRTGGTRSGVSAAGRVLVRAVLRTWIEDPVK